MSINFFLFSPLYVLEYFGILFFLCSARTQHENRIWYEKLFFEFVLIWKLIFNLHECFYIFSFIPILMRKKGFANHLRKKKTFPGTAYTKQNVFLRLQLISEIIYFVNRKSFHCSFAQTPFIDLTVIFYFTMKTYCIKTTMNGLSFARTF